MGEGQQGGQKTPLVKSEHAEPDLRGTESKALPADPDQIVQQLL